MDQSAMSYAGAGSRRDARLVRQHGRQLIGEEVTGRVALPNITYLGGKWHRSDDRRELKNAVMMGAAREREEVCVFRTGCEALHPGPLIYIVCSVKIWGGGQILRF